MNKETEKLLVLEKTIGKVVQVNEKDKKEWIGVIENVINTETVSIKNSKGEIEVVSIFDIRYL